MDIWVRVVPAFAMSVVCCILIVIAAAYRANKTRGHYSIDYDQLYHTLLGFMSPTEGVLAMILVPPHKLNNMQALRYNCKIALEGTSLTTSELYFLRARIANRLNLNIPVSIIVTDELHYLKRG